MKYYINRIAWVTFIICILGFTYQILTLAKIKSQYNLFSAQYAGVEAEYENEMSWGSILPSMGKSFFDGMTFGYFAEEGMFTEYNKAKRWENDITKREATIRAKINQCVKDNNSKFKIRNNLFGIGIVSLLVGIFTKERKQTIINTYSDNMPEPTA